MTTIKLLILLLLGMAQPAKADLRLLETERVMLDAWKIEDHRDMYFPYNKPGTGGEEWTVGAAFVIDLNFMAYRKWAWYWRNRPFMNATSVQVREAGWQWETGVTFGKCVDLYWYHLSDHVLDAEVPGRYPLHNFYGVRVVFYDRERKCWEK